MKSLLKAQTLISIKEKLLLPLCFLDYFDEKQLPMSLFSCLLVKGMVLVKKTPLLFLKLCALPLFCWCLLHNKMRDVTLLFLKKWKVSLGFYEECSRSFNCSWPCSEYCHGGGGGVILAGRLNLVFFFFKYFVYTMLLILLNRYIICKCSFININPLFWFGSFDLNFFLMFSVKLPVLLKFKEILV